MSKSYLRGTPITDWMTPPIADCESTTIHNKRKETPEGQEFAPMKEQLYPVIKTKVVSCPKVFQEQVASPNTQLMKQQVESPVNALSNYHVLNSLASTKEFNQHLASKKQSVHTPRLFLHDNLQGNDIRHCYKVSSQKSPSRPPPKAIVSPLIGGVVRTRSRTTDNSQTVHTCESESKKLNCVKPVSDDYANRLQLSGGVEELKTVLETKDKILAQKSRLIERQEQSIANLQLQLREIETQFLTMATEVHRKNIPTLRARIKELEYENVSLKAQLSGILQKEHEIQQLGRNLSGIEFHKSTLERRTKGQPNKVLLDCKRESPDVHLHTPSSDIQQALDSDCVTSLKKHHTPQQEMDEFGVNYKKSTESQEDKEIKRLQAELTDYSLLVKKSKENCQSLDQKVAALWSEKVKLVTECQKLQRLLFDSEAHCRHELQAMRERHKQRFVEATAELRLRHKAIAKRVRALELQLLRNSDVISALNNELQVSHGTIGDLKLSMNELVSQNQHLVEQNITLQESTFKEHAVKSSSCTVDVNIQKLTVELAHCVEDFESLVMLCSSLLEQSDPSASLILGVEGSQSVLDTLGTSDAELVLESSVGDKLMQVKQLKTKVDHLRELVSEQFASQVSNACHVQ